MSVLTIAFGAGAKGVLEVGLRIAFARHRARMLRIALDGRHKQRAHAEQKRGHHHARPIGK